MSDTRTVSGSRAAATAAGAMRPSAPGFSQVTRQPSRARCRQLSSTALCSVSAVTRCRPWDFRKRAAPMTARLSASVAPEVKITSSGSAWMSPATLARHCSTRAAACRPGPWVPAAGLAASSGCPERAGHRRDHFLRHRRAGGVVQVDRRSLRDWHRAQSRRGLSPDPGTRLLRMPRRMLSSFSSRRVRLNSRRRRRIRWRGLAGLRKPLPSRTRSRCS